MSSENTMVIRCLANFFINAYNFDAPKFRLRPTLDAKHYSFGGSFSFFVLIGYFLCMIVVIFHRLSFVWLCLKITMIPQVLLKHYGDYDEASYQKYSILTPVDSKFASICALFLPLA